MKTYKYYAPMVGDRVKHITRSVIAQTPVYGVIEAVHPPQRKLDFIGGYIVPVTVRLDDGSLSDTFDSDTRLIG